MQQIYVLIETKEQPDFSVHQDAVAILTNREECDRLLAHLSEKSESSFVIEETMLHDSADTVLASVAERQTRKAKRIFSFSTWKLERDSYNTRTEDFRSGGQCCSRSRDPTQAEWERLATRLTNTDYILSSRPFLSTAFDLNGMSYMSNSQQVFPTTERQLVSACTDYPGSMRTQ